MTDRPNPNDDLKEEREAQKPADRAATADASTRGTRPEVEARNLDRGDIDPRYREADQIDDRIDKATLPARTRYECDSLREEYLADPVRGTSAASRLERLDRIAQTSDLRHLPNFDPERVMELEDFEIAENPESVVRQYMNEGRGMPSATQHKLGEALVEQDRAIAQGERRDVATDMREQVERRRHRTGG